MSTPRFRLAGTVLSTPDAGASAEFYERLLGWPRVMDEPGWVVLRAENEWAGLSFHHDEHYVAPVWPSNPHDQQAMAHLDIATDDFEASIAHAVACGASVADHQPQAEVRVMLDPDGHPFCLFASTRM